MRAAQVLARRYSRARLHARARACPRRVPCSSLLLEIPPLPADPDDARPAWAAAGAQGARDARRMPSWSRPRRRQLQPRHRPAWARPKTCTALALQLAIIRYAPNLAFPPSSKARPPFETRQKRRRSTARRPLQSYSTPAFNCGFSDLVAAEPWLRNSTGRSR